VGAAAVIVCFGYLCQFMLSKSLTLRADEQFRWDRILMIFNAVQTMAAAALGVVLGTTVQQARVERAEAKADVNATKAAKADAALQLIDGLQPPGAQVSNADVASLAAILR
jgi:hypothetical protein